ncbi:MAG: flagellar biosynthesis repressor FlbT [Alphaproteobacteria bacterium]|nr:flagellar biosynthesis repressor FlbT [Alphaproteobacteria bacterium]
MPLRIKLPAKERIIVNGAVIENAGDATTIVLHNRADVLRRKEVMSEAEASSPARRVYYALQCAYMFDEERPRYAQHARQFLHQYLEAAPSAGELAEKIEGLIAEGKLYNALRATQSLIEHEDERLQAIGIKPDQPSDAAEDAAEEGRGSGQ